MISLDLRPTSAEFRADLLEQRVAELSEKLLQLRPLSGRGGWWPVSIREPYTGAWQRNDEIRMDTVLTFAAVFACTTLIMSDIGKLNLRLVELDRNGIWNEVDVPAFSPVLRKPNRYQNRQQFVETWLASKLNSGNVYVLKVYDNRNVVSSMFVLDPTRVTPLVALDGSVYYELKRDDLSGIPDEVVTVPASQIIHDRFNCLFHPLVGLSPIFACALAANQGLSIHSNSNKLFSNGSIPGGVLTAPGAISDTTAQRIKQYWDTNFTGDNVGKVAVLGDGLQYKGMAWNAVDLQLVEQLNMTSKTVCTAYHVPPQLVDIGSEPAYANITPYIQKYYSQCLQTLMTALEMSLDEGLGLGRQFGNAYGTELDPDDLIWLDTETRVKAAKDGVTAGLSYNEIRKRYWGVGPVKGGESPLSQQQYFSLEALAERDANQPFAKPTEPPAATAPDDAMSMASFAEALRVKLAEMDVMHG